jgi:hypothetical protein
VLITLHILERKKIKTKTLIKGQEGAENDGGTETKMFEFLLCLELCLDLRILGYLTFLGDTRWCSLLRHYATSRKVAGSIPDGVTGIFH